jgi:hypothetical protein
MESGAVQPAGGGKGAPSGQGPTGEPTEPEPTESPTPWPTSKSFRATVVAEGLMSGQTWRLMLDPPRGGKRVCPPVFGLLQPYGWTGARCYPAGAWGDMSLHQVVHPGLPKLAPVWGFISTRVQSVTG